MGEGLIKSSSDVKDPKCIRETVTQFSVVKKKNRIQSLIKDAEYDAPAGSAGEPQRLQSGPWFDSGANLYTNKNNANKENPPNELTSSSFLTNCQISAVCHSDVSGHIHRMWLPAQGAIVSGTNISSH